MVIVLHEADRKVTIFHNKVVEGFKNAVSGILA